MTKTVAKQIAKTFKRGRGRAWPWVGDVDAIVDAEVMDQVRIAAAYKSDWSPVSICDFRQMLVEALGDEGYCTPAEEDRRRAISRERS